MKTTELTKIEKLEKKYYRPLFEFADRLCGDPVKAMVLTQRTFRLAFDYSCNFPIPANKRAWLSAILFNRFLNA
ncbi:MAG TPA: hypothetical protein VH255_06835 [Verrucomicrobiae bacterium]|jgi:DNA-directed RNA polymerase specialized sigma24 family protein|nr:hypothetical protein [Verrucomicrobiae bacterium]